MHINVYAEQFPSSVQKVTKTAKDGKTYVGLAFITKGPGAVDAPADHHRRPEDQEHAIDPADDAVIFWAASDDDLVDLMNIARGAAGF